MCSGVVCSQETSIHVKRLFRGCRWDRCDWQVFPSSSLHTTRIDASSITAENYGRKKTFLTGLVIMSIGAILQATAYGVPHMIVARLITGVGNGFVVSLPILDRSLDSFRIHSINTATAPVWQSETSKPSLRGKLIVFSMM